MHFHLLIISDASRFKTVNSFLHAQNCQEFGTTKWRLGQHVDETKQALFFGPTYVTQYPLMIFPQLIISYERLRVPAATYEVLEKATWSTTRTPSLWNRPLGSQHDSMVLNRDPEDPEGTGGTTHGTFETTHGASEHRSRIAAVRLPCHFLREAVLGSWGRFHNTQSREKPKFVEKKHGAGIERANNVLVPACFRQVDLMQEDGMGNACRLSRV